jgi:SOS response regulatory protein OraA/RecX
MRSARRPAGASNARRSAPPLSESLAAALRFLTRGDRSANHVRRYLIARGCSEAAAQTTVRRLHRLGYLNDDKVALRLAQDRLARHPVGRAALIEALKAREFSDETAVRAAREAYAGTTEKAVAERLLGTLGVRFQDRAREIRRRAALLSARGFADDVVESCLSVAFEPGGQNPS